MSVWTPEQQAFEQLRIRARNAVHAIYPEALDFRLVRTNGEPVGWTFHTGHYPRSDFGWVTVKVRVGAAKHELRLSARRELKEQGEDR